MTVGWLPVGVRVKQIRLLHVHRIFNRVAPKYMYNSFNLVSESHGHFTRRSVNNLFVPRVKLFGFTSFVYTSIIEWNKLQNDIKILQNRCT